MSQAEDLLDNLTPEEMALYTINPKTEEFITIDENRTITVPDELRRIAVQYDNNIETVSFSCPRYWDEHDLSTMFIYINYQRPDNQKGRYLAKNVRVDESDESIFHFDWIIGAEITQAIGNIKFSVCAMKSETEENDDLHWNTEINSQLTISPGLECTDSVVGEYPDIINDLLTRMEAIENGGGSTGGTITPSDDGAGNVTLTLSGNLSVSDDGTGNIVIG